MSFSLLNQKKYICYRCRKTSTLNKELISCDFCTLFWHLECIASPLEQLPGAEWMCPQHQKPINPIKGGSSSKKNSLKSQARDQSVEEFEEADEIVRYGGVVHDISEKTLENSFLDYAKRYRTFNRSEKRNQEADVNKIETSNEAEEWLDNLTSFQFQETNHDGIQMLIDAANITHLDKPHLLDEKKSNDKVVDLDEKQHERFEAIQELINLKGEDALIEMLSKKKLTPS